MSTDLMADTVRGKSIAEALSRVERFSGAHPQRRIKHLTISEPTL